MKSKALQRLLRILITLLGAGLGAAVALLGLQVFSLAAPGKPIPLRVLVLAYVGLSLAGGLVFFALRYPIQQFFSRLFGSLEQRFLRMPFNQMVSCVTGLLTGLIVASLLCQILHFVGDGMVTVLIAALLFLGLGAFGWTMGSKRGKDFTRYLVRLNESRMTRHEAKMERKRQQAARSGISVKILDTSALIDGRIADICQAGFLEGTLVLPDFILDELRQVADSSDGLRRARGKRGLETLDRLRECPEVALRADRTDWTDTQDADVKLLRLAKQLKASLITGDSNLAKVAAVSEVRVLSVNQLALSLKPVVLPGETMAVLISREGKESEQGVGYLNDGTMIVVEGGRAHIGETVSVTVTGALQTSAGRMIFARAV